MFNKTIINKTETNPATRVIEKTITPDKVTDMYKDVRKEVEKSIIRALRVETNYMHGVVIEIHENYESMQKKMITRFVLNGKEYIDTTWNKNNKENILSSDEHLIHALHQHYQRVISNEIFKNMNETLIHKLR